MARRGQAKQAFLSLVDLGRRDSHQVARGMEKHQHISKSNLSRGRSRMSSKNPSELLDRYLQAVRFWLPKGQQDDIIEELSEDIRSHVEEKESTLGRPLNQSEMEAILRQHGRPVLVANRFLPQQYLIGPLLFPIYKFVLKVVASCYLIPWVLVWIGLLSFSPAYRAHQLHQGWLNALLSAWSSLWLVALIALTVVTIVFAVLERMQSKSPFMQDWNPRKLPPLRDRNQIPRSESLLELGVNLA